MTDAESPSSSAAGTTSTRVGNVERQQAMDALDVHMSAGRLDPDEYGQRVGKASVARTIADLDPLFADLPAPHATGAVAPPAQVPFSAPSAKSMPTPGWLPPPPAPGQPGRQMFGARRPLAGRVGEVAVGLSPFIALLLFFATGGFFSNSWVFFLLVPIVGVIVYGNDHGHGRDRRDRQDRRDRGRNSR